MTAQDWADVEARGGEVVRPAPWKLAGSAAGLSLVAAIGAAMATVVVDDGGTLGDVAWLLGWAALSTLCVVLAFRALVRLVRREPVVGYDDRALHLSGVGTIPWQAISEIRIDEVGRGRGAKLLIGVYLHDPKPLLREAALRRRLEGRLELWAKRAPLPIHPFNLPLELHVLAARLQRRHEAALRRAGHDLATTTSAEPDPRGGYQEVDHEPGSNRAAPRPPCRRR